MDLEEIARKYALRNAVEHDGSCNPGAVIGKIFAEEEFEDKGQVTKTAQKVCEEVNEMSLEQQEEAIKAYEFEEQEKEEHEPIPDLEDAEEGEVVVRFAPNPNGPPTLGSSRGMVINGELRDKYDGKLILRFDDTDPRTKRPLIEAYDWYVEDYSWLGYEPDEIIHSSKQFDKYYEEAEKLIEKEKAYVCRCSAEEGRKYREQGEACPHRGKSAEENMADWEGMKDGGVEEGEAVLRIKTDMGHKNPAVRDFVAFRIIEEPDHPITGDKYRVWPLLDFAGAIEDQYMGTTHIVRGKDLRASTKRQKYIYEYLGWDYPHVRYWGRVSIDGLETTMSTSSLGEMVEKGEIDGWDDPRAPTVRSFRRRGFQSEALVEFWKEMGVTENDTSVSLKTLESHNRKFVDDEANRLFFVREPVEVEVENVPEDVEPHMRVHPEHEERGKRSFPLDRDGDTLKVLMEKEDFEDGYIRLKGLCNIEISGDSAVYREGDHTEALARDAGIVHWAPASAEVAEVVMPDASSIVGRIEPSDVEEDEVVQFERFGFVRCDDTSENRFYFTHS